MPPSASAYSLGLVFILLVSVIWSGSSVLVQYLYADQSFDSPFLVTYIGTSLFVLLLPSQWLWEAVRGACGWGEDKPQYNSVSQSEEGSLVDSSGDSGDRAGQCQRGGTAVTASRSSLEDGSDRSEDPVVDIPPWTHADHRMAAYKIAPMWFMSNWAYNVSLQYTSITSSTVLASTGSLFTFCFAIIVGDEKFSGYKLLGVALGMAGSLITSLNDVIDSSGDSPTPLDDDDDRRRMLGEDPNNLVWLGDLLGVISAVGYGFYAVLIRTCTPEDSNKMSMQILLGYIGLVNMIALSPICIYQMTVQHGNGLTWFVLGCLVVKGSFDNVLSDYLWARAVILTSATVATVGLGLTIPLAFISDWVLGKLDTSPTAVLLQIVGAVSVIVGFILVNIGQNEPAPVASETSDISLEDMESRRYRDEPEGEQRTAEPPTESTEL